MGKSKSLNQAGSPAVKRGIRLNKWFSHDGVKHSCRSASKVAAGKGDSGDNPSEKGCPSNRKRKRKEEKGYLSLIQQPRLDEGDGSVSIACGGGRFSEEVRRSFCFCKSFFLVGAFLNSLEDVIPFHIHPPCLNRFCIVELGCVCLYVSGPGYGVFGFRNLFFNFITISVKSMEKKSDKIDCSLDAHISKDMSSPLSTPQIVPKSHSTQHTGNINFNEISDGSQAILAEVDKQKIHVEPLDDQLEKIKLEFLKSSLRGFVLENPINCKKMKTKLLSFWRLIRREVQNYDKGHGWVEYIFNVSSHLEEVWGGRPYHVLGRLLIPKPHIAKSHSAHVDEPITSDKGAFKPPSPIEPNALVAAEGKMNVGLVLGRRNNTSGEGNRGIHHQSKNIKSEMKVNYSLLLFWRLLCNDHVNLLVLVSRWVGYEQAWPKSQGNYWFKLGQHLKVVCLKFVFLLCIGNGCVMDIALGDHNCNDDQYLLRLLDWQVKVRYLFLDNCSKVNTSVEAFRVKQRGCNVMHYSKTFKLGSSKFMDYAFRLLESWCWACDNKVLSECLSNPVGDDYWCYHVKRPNNQCKHHKNSKQCSLIIIWYRVRANNQRQQGRMQYQGLLRYTWFLRYYGTYFWICLGGVKGNYQHVVSTKQNISAEIEVLAHWVTSYKRLNSYGEKFMYYVYYLFYYNPSLVFIQDKAQANWREMDPRKHGLWMKRRVSFLDISTNFGAGENLSSYLLSGMLSVYALLIKGTLGKEGLTPNIDYKGVIM